MKKTITALHPSISSAQYANVRWHPIDYVVIFEVDGENFELSYIAFIIEYSSFSSIFERFFRISEI